MSTAEAGRARLFFGLWPDDSVRAGLSGLAREAHAECGGRAIPAEKIHLTLFFVGSVERGRIARLEAAAQRVHGEAFQLAIDRIGYWRHNKIVWAGAARVPPALVALEASLREGLEGEGLRGEDRPYSPHVTLVRDAERKPAPREVGPLLWNATDFVLAESVAVKGGVRYDVRRRWPLARA